MMLHRHFEGDVPKTVTRLDDVAPKATDIIAEPEAEVVQPAKKTSTTKKK